VTSNFDRLARDPGFKALFRIARHRDVAKGHVIIAEGEKPGNLFLLLSGLVAVRHETARGKDLLLAYLYPGDFFGEMCLFPGVDARSAMIQAAADCVLLEVGYETFVDLTRTHSSLWLQLAGQLAARLRTTNRRLAEMPALHAAERVWLVISEMAASIDPIAGNGKRIIHITRQDLGKLAGCSRELAGMVLKDLAKSGHVVVKGRSIELPDPARPA
jgi:CRP/FNR family transcriptional regulator, cyclic AMP receptor protein